MQDLGQGPVSVMTLLETMLYSLGLETPIRDNCTKVLGLRLQRYVLLGITFVQKQPFFLVMLTGPLL